MPHRFHLIDLLLFTSPVAFVVFVLVVVLMFVVLLVFVLVVAPVWLESWLRVALLARRWAARRLECGPVPGRDRATSLYLFSYQAAWIAVGNGSGRSARSHQLGTPCLSTMHISRRRSSSI